MDYYFGTTEGNNIILSAEEFNHLKNVKRIKPGDTVMVTDGKGVLYTSRFAGNTSPLEIVSKEIIGSPKQFVHIAVAPTKNIDRIEWFLEKAIETGINAVTFITCRHSERREIKSDRLLRVAIAALKQSKKTYLPDVRGMIDFSDFVTANITGEKLIFTQSADDSFKKNYSTGRDLVALIGPEGDFHPDELVLAKVNGFKTTTLGNSRLRTETAALSVCTLFNFINTQ